MKRLLSYIFLIYFSPSLYSQTGVAVKEVTVSTNPADTSEGNSFLKVDVEAEYPGGDEGWKKFLIKGLTKITREAIKDKQPSGTYSVMVAFYVAKDGIVLINGISSTPVNKYLEAKCAAMISQSKNWIPGTQNGKPVKAYRKQPITIVIQ